MTSAAMKRWERIPDSSKEAILEGVWCGKCRTGVLIVCAEGDLPATGAEIVADGRALGRLGSVQENKGLAIVRIDRVKDAIDADAAISADGVPVSLSIPSWVKFTFPQGAPTDDAP